MATIISKYKYIGDKNDRLDYCITIESVVVNETVIFHINVSKDTFDKLKEHDCINL